MGVLLGERVLLSMIMRINRQLLWTIKVSMRRLSAQADGDKRDTTDV